MMAFAKHFNLKVIEDAAHACGAAWDGSKVGSFGLTCFSFHAVKNLPIGDGGMITTNDQDIADRLRRLRWMGIDRSTYARTRGGSYQWEYEIDEIGYKYHMNDILATIGIDHLQHLNEWNKRRAEIFWRYYKNLCPYVGWVKGGGFQESSHHLCVVKVDNRDEVYKKLSTRGIGVGVHYRPNHLYPMFAECRRGRLVETKRAYNRILSLPNHLMLSDSDIDWISEQLIEVLE